MRGKGKKRKVADETCANRSGGAPALEIQIVNDETVPIIQVTTYLDPIPWTLWIFSLPPGGGVNSR